MRPYRHHLLLVYQTYNITVYANFVQSDPTTYAPTAHRHVSNHPCIIPTEILTAVEGTTTPLKRVHNVESSHSLALRVLSIGDAVSDNLVQLGQSHPPLLDPRATYPLEEVLQDRTGLFINEARDTFHCARYFRLPPRHTAIYTMYSPPPRRARRRMAGFVIPWMLSRNILR